MSQMRPLLELIYRECPDADDSSTQVIGNFHLDDHHRNHFLGERGLSQRYEHKEHTQALGPFSDQL